MKIIGAIIDLDYVHTASGPLPDSSEPFASCRRCVGFAFTLLTTEVGVSVAVFTLRPERDPLTSSHNCF